MTSKRCAGAEMLYFDVTPDWFERVKDHAVARSAAPPNQLTLFESDSHSAPPLSAIVNRF
jgi:hypothetical protein